MEYDLGVIGAGPAGYTACFEALKENEKSKIVLFEKGDLGGTCLNLGCVPTKTIMHSSEVFKQAKTASKAGIEIEGEIKYDWQKILERKNKIVSLFKKSLETLLTETGSGVEIVRAEAKILSDNKIKAGEKIYNCKNIIIATGSKPSDLKGFERDGKFILNSDDIFNLERLPKSIVIIGSGAIGVEWARIFSNFGLEVTVLEIASNLLPDADFEVSKRLERIFKTNKIKFYTSTSIEKIENKTLYLSNGEKLTPEAVLVAAGRKIVMPEIEEATKFYSAGDVTKISSLAHSAARQALLAVKQIYVGKNTYIRDFDKNLVPAVIYGNPEIAWVGKCERDLEGTEYKKAVVPILSLAKAHADNEIEGFVKLLSLENKIIGAHVISKEASSLIFGLTLAIQKQIEINELKEIIFPHPTYSEAIFGALNSLK